MRLTARASYVFVAAGGVVVASYALADSAVVKSVLVVTLAAAAAIAIAIGIRVHRPSLPLAWAALFGAHAIYAVCWVFWQWGIVTNGVPPALDSAVNITFLLATAVAAAALVMLSRRIDREALVVFDVGILIVAMFAIAWTTIAWRYVESADVTSLGKGVQIAYAIVDITVLAVLLRIGTSARRWTPSLALLLASGLGLVFSDGIWNWSTQLGDYAPGSWADLGWLAFHVFAGAAALHPSMRTLYEDAPAAGGAGLRGRLALLGVAALVPVVVLTFVDAQVEPVRGIPAVAAGGLLALLIVGRVGVTATSQHRLAREFSEQNERLLELDRLKDEFVASVSHELRTPLTSIRGYLELVRGGEAGELTPDQEKFLEIVDRNADRLLGVVTDLLFVAQVDAGKLALELKPLDLEEIVRHTVDAAGPAAEAKNLELRLELGPLPPVLGDGARLGQLLDNLVSNAVKFTASGRVNVRALATADHAVIEVADTGMGIPPEEQERLFQRFYRTRGATEQAIQGTGLGLSIAHAIAEAHGGIIGVTSVVGRGTTFRVELPILAAPTSELPHALAERSRRT